jgi:hypothetical protein
VGQNGEAPPHRDAVSVPQGPVECCTNSWQIGVCNVDWLLVVFFILVLFRKFQNFANKYKKHPAICGVYSVSIFQNIYLVLRFANPSPNNPIPSKAKLVGSGTAAASVHFA